MSYPDVTVLIVTYDRPLELRRTLAALRDRLCYEGTIHWHIADDGSPAIEDALPLEARSAQSGKIDYISSLRVDFPQVPFSYTICNRGGWGRNVNMAIRFITQGDPDALIFLCEDDYVLRRNLDLCSGVALLLAEESLGAVRYDGIEGHALDLELREVSTDRGRQNYLRILKASPMLNVYSNRPHLTHRRFREAYGPYAEGLSLGRTEENYAHRVKDEVSGPDVAVLPTGIVCSFDHIGVSRQGTIDDLAGVKN